MAKPTIANVAELAGVSQATVSRALRGATNVTEETRIKVQRAADQLNFTLSKSASALASGKTMRVILLVSGKLNEWFNSGVLKGPTRSSRRSAMTSHRPSSPTAANWTGFSSQLPKKPQRGRHHHFLISAHARHARPAPSHRPADRGRQTFLRNRVISTPPSASTTPVR